MPKLVHDYETATQNNAMLHLCTGIVTRNKVHAMVERGAANGLEMGSLMKKVVIVIASTIGFAGAAVAADLPVRQPVPPPVAGFPAVGKAPIGKGPIGKGPIGKAPIGKGPIGKGPVVAPAPPIATRG